MVTLGSHRQCPESRVGVTVSVPPVVEESQSEFRPNVRSYMKLLAVTKVSQLLQVLQKHFAQNRNCGVSYIVSSGKCITITEVLQKRFLRQKVPRSGCSGHGVGYWFSLLTCGVLITASGRHWVLPWWGHRCRQRHTITIRQLILSYEGIPCMCVFE